jgi:cellulose biosynthesis protein BcsQ
MRPALYTLQGTNDLVATIQKVRKGLNEDLEILGVIVNGFDSQPVITRQIKSEIDEGFGSLVFSTVLSQSVKIEEAIATRGSCIIQPRFYFPGGFESRAASDILVLMNYQEANPAWLR